MVEPQSKSVNNDLTISPDTALNTAILKPRTKPLELKGLGHDGSGEISPKILFDQVVASQRIEGFEPYHKSPEELMSSVNEQQRKK